MRESASGSDAITLDLFARRGSWRGLPLVSLDPAEIGPIPADPLAWFAAQELIYGQLWLSGMLTGYDIVHCLAPVISPLQLMAAAGTPVVQSVIEAWTHPACWLAARLLPDSIFRRVAMTRETGAALGIPVVQACVDLSRFTVTDEPAEYLVWDGGGGKAASAAVQAIGERLGYPVRGVADSDAPAVLRKAVALLHLAETASPCGFPWPLRALACGVPVAGWQETLAGLVSEPGLGALAPAGEWRALADRIPELTSRGESARRRREMVLARHGPTSTAAQYRKIYHELVNDFTSGS
jgi:glycosyltransferase involved in cell wall biosynthesis